MRAAAKGTLRVATRGTTRAINRGIVLDLIRTNQPISRADLARLMGTRRGAVSLLVDELIRDRAIFEGATGEVAHRRARVAAIGAGARALGPEPAQRWYDTFLWSRALTISGGASEILRGLVGRQLLGLPRA